MIITILPGGNGGFIRITSSGRGKNPTLKSGRISEIVEIDNIDLYLREDERFGNKYRSKP
jgi:hypothetical protein